jgi:putative ABC transport system permease protein
MKISSTLGLAFEAITRNKLRSALTSLGIIMGVGAVIVMMALGDGAHASIEQRIQSLGTDVVTVTAGSANVGGVRMGQGANTTLVGDDAVAIAAINGVRAVSPGVSMRTQVVASAGNWQTQVQGTGAAFATIRAWDTSFGSFFTDEDVERAARVAVLGAGVRDQVFGAGEDPVGQIIRISNQPFRVIGVLSRKGQSAMGQDQDDTIFAPYTTVQKKLQGITHINNITVSAATAETAPVAEAIRQQLRVRHKLVGQDPDDFMVRTLEEMASVRSETARTMGTLLAAIAGVSLLVGGIGIMNIMLVSVTERTREIGLRMAIGARGKDVLLQFLVEAVVLSLFGGLIGIAFGFGLAAAAEKFLAWPTTIPPNAIGMAFGFAAITGVFFGFYPARKAASLDPIEALRFE